jgi:YHS domain-containing protein
VKRLLIAAAALLLWGCPEPQPVAPLEMRTIEDTRLPALPTRAPDEIDPTVTQTPLSEELGFGTDEPVEGAPEPPKPPPSGEAISLPFAPPIALDPVNGSKLTIRSNTPIYEFKGRLYYFETEANKRAFEANPEQYLTGSLGRF